MTLDPDPKWAKTLDPDPNSIYLDPQHWDHLHMNLPILGFGFVDMAIGPSPHFAALKLKQVLHLLPLG